MESHYIKGTNRQYSIREDGTIVRHYKSREPRILKYTYLSNNHIPVISLTINGIRGTKSVSKLMTKYFPYLIVNLNNPSPFPIFKDNNNRNYSCNNLIFHEVFTNNEAVTKYRINNKEKRKNSNNKWRNNNLEEVKKNSRIHSKRHVEIISKSYASAKLNIPVKLLTNELYLIYKENLIFKRQLAKKYNISINYGK